MANIPRPHINKPQMETFHRGHATSALWTALPGPVTMIYSMIAAGSITGMAWYLGDTYADGKGSTWTFIAIGVMTVIALILLLIRVSRAKKQSRMAGSFEEAVKGSAAGWDGGGAAGTDPAEMARLDNLRKQFQKGIDSFREYGKDFYSLPWYVMVGEPGSGKTEAIRHSDLRFPETLQDMLQGTGGTYSMDWWFTNQAVLLDTAGAMLMNPEATKRFEEFLKLLRTYRPDCPVNGIILAIPVDSLLADNAAKLEEKAKRISQQFGIIQKALDVRFPIYLMVTKSDRLPGFREFSDAAGQQTFDREMLGWSNPADLDTPFDPANIGSALQAIATRLQARSLALLADPIPRQAGNRRVDEVDSLYGFPSTILSLEPRLRRYLEIIFQTGTWATLPPFFRGVYFTSAMNEGAALDEQLASALGMSIETLPGGGLFNRDKSVYLRDVFTEKVFRERGLVTRLKDIGKALRRKLVWFYTTAAILLMLLLGVAWLEKRKIDQELLLEQENWRVANATWGNGAFLPIVIRTESPDVPGVSKARPRWTAAWQGENARVWKKLGDGDKDNLTKVEFLAYLEQRTAKGLPGAAIFHVLPSIKDFERRRRVACLAVYEGSVLKPVLEGVREKIVWDARDAEARNQHRADAPPSDPEQDRRLAGAYDALVRLEATLQAHAAGEKIERWKADDYRKILEPMLLYLCPPSADGKNANLNASLTSNAAADLADIAERLYAGSLFGNKKGTESLETRTWLKTPDDGANNSLGRLALEKGLEAILGTGGVAQTAVESEGDRKQLQAEKENALKLFEEAEDQLGGLTAANATRAVITDSLVTLRGHLESLDTARGKLGDASKLTGMSRSDLSILCKSLKTSLDLLTEAQMPAHLRPVYAKAGDVLKSSPAPVSPLTPEPGAGDEKEKAVTGKTASPEDAARIRFETYQKRLTQADKIQASTLTIDLVGRLEAEALGINQKVEAARAAAKLEYDGPRKEECGKACAAIDLCMGEIATGKLLKAYTEVLRAFLDPRLKFPLVRTANKDRRFTLPEFKPAIESLGKVEKDRLFFDSAPAGFRASQGADVLAKYFEAFNDVMTIAKVLKPDNASQPAGDGLYAKRSFVKPAEKKNVPVVPMIDPITRQPIPPQTTPEAVDVGVTVASVSQGGFVLIGETGAAVSKKINPNKPIQIQVQRQMDVRALQPETQTRTIPERADNDPWGLINWWIDNKTDHQIQVLGIVFGIEASPSLPSVWPVRRSFGLND